MRISWNWLRSLIATDGSEDLSVQEAAEVLTSTGLEVESVELLEPVKGMLQGVVVGHVLECAKHPDADRLSVCLVDQGAEGPVQIICGAPNVAVGQKVLVATVGATLHMTEGDVVIKKAKIRGIESHGMICAEDELGLGQSHAGIIVLDPSAKPGTPAAEQLGLRTDHVLEIGLTPNRSDALGHFGVARDLVAALRHRLGRGLRLKPPHVSAFRDGGPGQAITVEVENPHVCPRYCGLTLTDVHVAPSPTWLQDRLRSIGLKPINNVVDITNFVQHELGQPLHAFDAARIHEGRILVRHLAAGTLFTTLDGTERTLSDEDLMITDTAGGLCIAGVYGGMGSGVTDGTTTVFLESACFDPVSIRRTAKRHALHTDASFRFERGADPEITRFALERAALLLMEVTGARPVGTVIDAYPHPRPWREVRLHLRNIEGLTGLSFAMDEVVGILELLDCRIAERSETDLLVQVPPYRTDVHREADLVEEVLRIHGFDRVPLPASLQVPPAALRKEVSAEAGKALADHLAARGFREIMTPSLVNGASSVGLGAADPEQHVRLRNPLSAELDVLRPSLLFGALQAAAHNVARQRRDLRLFERGRVYARTEKGAHEEDRTALLITGKRWRERWRAEAPLTELADVKAELELLLERILPNARATWEPAMHPLLHDVVEARVGKRLMALAGGVHPKVHKAFGIAQPVFFAELIDAHWIQEHRSVKFVEVPKYPEVRRDLSLLLDRSVTFARLRSIALHAERKLLRQVDLFDVYEGDKLPQGKMSYALSFILQDVERTLTDEQVDKAMERIRTALELEAGAVLRG
ncbi:MAG: phenylalanine--tRNA ligase subunit beta [Flavobacteriales bacterium]|nr:phenylalanine--tRNA ligase subunit beta [Flavobacteriales bacterium]